MSSAPRLASLLGLRGLGFTDIDRSIVSSTVPQLSEEWTAMAERYLGHEMLDRRAVDPHRDADPDRQSAGGRRRPAGQRGRRLRRVARHCVVVDFGTAITYDAVSAAGEYLGGIITPGAEISIDALYERAAKLPKVELAEPRALIGKSTVEAIRSPGSCSGSPARSTGSCGGCGASWARTRR